MSDFIGNGASVLPAVKSDLRTPTGAVSEWKADDANQLRQAALDLRTEVINIEQAGAGVASSTLILAAGSTTQRTLASRFADVLNVKDFGAKGDGSTDDTAAVQAAVNAALANGGTVIFPRGKYRVTDRIVVGYVWVSETDGVNLSLANLEAAGSYNSTNHTAAQNAPFVSLVGQPGAVIWGDFATAGTQKAIIYYGIIGNNGKLTLDQARIEHLTILGQEAFSGGVYSPPAWTSALPANQHQIGIFYPEARSITISNVNVGETDYGFVTWDNYWSNAKDCRAYHNRYGFVGMNHNAARGDNLAAFGTRTTGFTFTGQQFTLTQLATQGAYQSLYMPSAEQPVVDGAYFEQTNSDTGIFSVILGDPGVGSPGSPLVRYGTFRNMHVNQASNKNVQVNNSYVEFDWSRIVRGVSGSTEVNGSQSALILSDTAVDTLAGSATANVVSVNRQGGIFTVQAPGAATAMALAVGPNGRGFSDTGTQIQTNAPFKVAGTGVMTSTKVQINQGAGSTAIDFAGTGPTLTVGSGTPESVVTAVVGSLFLRTDGGATTTLYVKTSGSGNTGWTAK
jgi:hypothetical protein